MELFWLKGYQGTSLQDLIAHLGISKGSLNSVYAGKKELFKRAFKRYIDTVGMQALEPLQHSGDARQLFRNALSEISGDGSRGRERIEADSWVLLTLFLGLRVLAKSGPDRAVAEAIVEKTLEGIV